MKNPYKSKVPTKDKAVSNGRVETTLSLRIEKDLKDRFLGALQVGRPATMTDVIEHLMAAYIDATRVAGRQPEFPLEVRSKPPTDPANS